MSMTREEAIKQMEEFMVIDDWSLVYLPYLHDALELAIEALKENRPHGEWLDDDVNSNEKNHFYKCSLCGGDGVPKCDFCPNCGASMAKKEGESE